MGIDTVSLRSPYIDHGTADLLDKQCTLKKGIDLSSGFILYEFTNGSLDGSYDSRISFRIMREEYRNINGRPELYPCDPYILTEASLHKVFFGQNVYGSPVGFRFLCHRYIQLLGYLLIDDIDGLPNPDIWRVQRVDWAEVYRLSPAAQTEFFRSLNHAKFPRRGHKTAKYGTNAVYFPGSTTTVKMYHKGPEFREHDFARLKQSLTKLRAKTHPYSFQYDDNTAWVNRRMAALVKLADNRLRVEVEVHARKLQDDFKGRSPYVHEVTDNYLKNIHDSEVFKLLREGKSDMETVRTHDLVKARLNHCYSRQLANNLYCFYMQMAARGEDIVRLEYSRPTFYRMRKQLVEVGVSWLSSDIFIIPQETALPKDFQPLRTDSRVCYLPVRAQSDFNLCPSTYRHKLAA